MNMPSDVRPIALDECQVRLVDAERVAAVKEALPPSESVDEIAEGFAVLADPNRVRLLISLLEGGELCVCDIVGLLRLSQPTVSRHLAYLRRTGLVEARPELCFTYYRLAEPRDAVHRNLIACVRSCFHGIGSLDSERRTAEARVEARQANPCRQEG